MSLDQSKLCCTICNKSYTRKSSYDKHKILCDFKLKSKREIIIENEEEDDIPNHLQLVKIVQELTLKLCKMEEKMEEMQKWVDKKKRKINILSWLNTNCAPTTSFIEWINMYLTVNQIDFENLMENSLFYTIQKIFERNLEITSDFIYPIKCFSQKQHVFYIYVPDTNNNFIWRQMIFDDFINLLKIVQNKMIKELSQWKTNNQGKFDDNDKIAELFNKAIIKLMNISFTHDNTFSRIRNTLYNYLKTDLKVVMDFEFEF